ncbi:hypothetical protein BDY24DRAFT_436658, partial [Mrakia frigida]|uniref:uncharacterized protein n=1 Tax=Mrakia frigida TaxID=29902 RepID=UPI003FCC0D03
MDRSIRRFQHQEPTEKKTDQLPVFLQPSPPPSSRFNMENFQCPYLLAPCPLVSAPDEDQFPPAPVQESAPPVPSRPLHPSHAASSLLAPPSFHPFQEVDLPSLPLQGSAIAPSSLLERRNQYRAEMTRNQQQREAGPKLIPAPLPPFPSSYGLSSSFPSGLIDQNPYAGLSPISPPSYPYQPYSSFASPNPQSSTPFFFPSHLPFPINTSVEPDHAPFYPPPEPSMALNYLQLQHPPSQQPGLVLDDLPSSSSSSSFPLSPDSLRGGGSAWHGFQEGLVSIDAVGKDETPTTRLDEHATGSGSPSTEEKGTGALLGEGLLGEQTAFVSKLWHILSHDEYKQHVCWSKDGKSFVILNQGRFAEVDSFRRGAADEIDASSSSSSSNHHHSPASSTTGSIDSPYSEHHGSRGGGSVSKSAVAI